MSRQLDPVDVEAIARRVVEMLGERGAPSQLVSAAELSRRLGLSRSTVYEKAEELGVIRIGNGPRARLRFDPDLVARSLGAGRAAVEASGTPPPRAVVRRRRATRRPLKPGLLPIRGEAPR
jgi:biotin operon repressor